MHTLTFDTVPLHFSFPLEIHQLVNASQVCASVSVRLRVCVMENESASLCCVCTSSSGR